MMNKRYMCPVCGFEDLEEPPYTVPQEPSYEICPCCGFEFGFDDADGVPPYDLFRSNWIKNGAAWFQPEQKPKNWDLKTQLKNIGYDTA